MKQKPNFGVSSLVPISAKSQLQNLNPISNSAKLWIYSLNALELELEATKKLANTSTYYLPTMFICEICKICDPNLGFLCYNNNFFWFVDWHIWSCDKLHQFIVNTLPCDSGTFWS
jgi:hypothetical protein